jgi:hypothetical protein
MRCRMTASLRATATLALRSPLRLASLIPQAFSTDHFGTRVSSTLAASNKRRAATKGAPFARLHLSGSRQPFEWPIHLTAARVSAVDFHQKVLCSSPHSLHVNGTRTCPWSADTRFGAPHFRHLLSIRVIPCFMVRFLRSKASFTRRSVSSRIACFDISYFLGLDAIGHTGARGPRQMNLFCHHDGAVSPPTAMESLHRDQVSKRANTPLRLSDRIGASKTVLPAAALIAWLRGAGLSFADTPSYKPPSLLEWEITWLRSANALPGPRRMFVR